MKNKRVFITGGTGFLGQAIVRKYYDENSITVFSRDESKHAHLKLKFPKINFVIGDVRNYDLLEFASREHDIAVFCASLKHVSAVNANVEEASAIIVQGAINARKVSIANKLKAACMISTDKSRNPITIYGAMKFIAGEQFIWDAEQHTTNLSNIICGNIINSTGSLIPMIWDAIGNQKTLPLFGSNMTRFTITDNEAAELVHQALGVTGCSVIPKLKSFNVKDVFDIYSRNFGLKYELVQSTNSVERQHECMVTKEDSSRLVNYGNYFSLHYKRTNPAPPALVNGEYNSCDYIMEPSELDQMLKDNKYFMPEKYELS